MTISAGSQALASDVLTEHNADGTHKVVLPLEHNADGTHKVVLPLEHNADGTHKAAALTSAGITTYVPSGVIWAYGGATPPSGWFMCFGQAVSRTTYADLFTAISTAYGVGDSSTTFNVPDLRGRFGLGKDNMGGSSANRVTATEADNLGQGSGAETHTLTLAEAPAHSHFMVAGGGAGTNSVNVANAQIPNSVATSSAGGDGAHNNMSPYQTVSYIIKT